MAKNQCKLTNENLEALRLACSELGYLRRDEPNQSKLHEETGLDTATIRKILSGAICQCKNIETLVETLKSQLEESGKKSYFAEPYCAEFPTTRSKKSSQSNPIKVSASEIAKLAFQAANPQKDDLSKQFTAEALNNLQVLQTLIWEQLQEKPGVEAIRQEFEQTQRMTPEQIAQMATLLEAAMVEDPKFADEIQQLVQAIDEGRLDEQSGRMWNQIINGENSEGYQFEVTGSSTAYIGGKHYHGKQD
jgi:hypothetical protein